MDNDIEQDSIFYCEKKEKCKWKCFALASNGFAIGRISQTLTAWQEAHTRYCGGKLIQAVIVDEVNQ